MFVSSTKRQALSAAIAALLLCLFSWGYAWMSIASVPHFRAEPSGPLNFTFVASSRVVSPQSSAQSRPDGGAPHQRPAAKRPQMPSGAVAKTPQQDLQEIAAAPPLTESSESSESSESGGPSAEPSRDSAISAGQSRELESYQALVLQRIAKHKVYPFGARLKGQEGDVGVVLRLAADGQVLGVSLFDASEYSLLNQAVLKSIRRARPFPAMPRNQGQAEALAIEFTMEFHLDSEA